MIGGYPQFRKPPNREIYVGIFRDVIYAHQSTRHFFNLLDTEQRASSDSLIFAQRFGAKEKGTGSIVYVCVLCIYIYTERILDL